MSMYRTCPNCFKTEGIRVNFGENHEAEKEFHKEKWCNCGYNSPEEMMKDQDMGFEDPRWIPIAKYFLKNYHLRIRQGQINSKEEQVRFFLKLLQSSANNYYTSLDLVNLKEVEGYKLIWDGKTETPPKVDIFKDDF